ncbi:hypothetical protein CLU92_5365 [Janthinobacterium sp. 61]|nr:hypothetical protein CLU92_5365 [Janthinobacterium sp. 61]
MKTKSTINIAIGTLVFLIISLNSSHAKEQTARMDCDSTCVVPSGMLDLIPKAHTFPATPTVPAPKPTCGPSGGSILPAAPSTFLCSSGNPSVVLSTTNDGETTYKWTCSNTKGAASCMAYKREPGVCGASNGTTISSTPDMLCASGDPSNLKLNGNQYSWFCTGNYGPKSSCTAQLYTPLPPACVEPPTLIQWGGFSCTSSSGPILSMLATRSVSTGTLLPLSSWVEAPGNPQVPSGYSCSAPQPTGISGGC